MSDSESGQCPRVYEVRPQGEEQLGKDLKLLSLKIRKNTEVYKLGNLSYQQGRHRNS